MDPSAKEEIKTEIKALVTMDPIAAEGIKKLQEKKRSRNISENNSSVINTKGLVAMDSTVKEGIKKIQNKNRKSRNPSVKNRQSSKYSKGEYKDKYLGETYNFPSRVSTIHSSSSRSFNSRYGSINSHYDSFSGDHRKNEHAGQKYSRRSSADTGSTSMSSSDSQSFQSDESIFTGNRDEREKGLSLEFFSIDDEESTISESSTKSDESSFCLDEVSNEFASAEDGALILFESTENSRNKYHDELKLSSYTGSVDSYMSQLSSMDIDIDLEKATNMREMNKFLRRGIMQLAKGGNEKQSTCVHASISAQPVGAGSKSTGTYHVDPVPLDPDQLQERETDWSTSMDFLTSPHSNPSSFLYGSSTLKSFKVANNGNEQAARRISVKADTVPSERKKLQERRVGGTFKTFSYFSQSNASLRSGSSVFLSDETASYGTYETGSMVLDEADTNNVDPATLDNILPQESETDSSTSLTLLSSSKSNQSSFRYNLTSFGTEHTGSRISDKDTCARNEIEKRHSNNEGSRDSVGEKELNSNGLSIVPYQSFLKSSNETDVKKKNTEPSLDFCDNKESTTPGVQKSSAIDIKDANRKCVIDGSQCREDSEESRNIDRRSVFKERKRESKVSEEKEKTEGAKVTSYGAGDNMRNVDKVKIPELQLSDTWTVQPDFRQSNCQTQSIINTARTKGLMYYKKMMVKTVAIPNKTRKVMVESMFQACSRIKPIMRPIMKLPTQTRERLSPRLKCVKRNLKLSAFNAKHENKSAELVSKNDNIRGDAFANKKSGKPKGLRTKLRLVMAPYLMKLTSATDQVTFYSDLEDLAANVSSTHKDESAEKSKGILYTSGDTRDLQPSIIISEDYSASDVSYLDVNQEEVAGIEVIFNEGVGDVLIGEEDVQTKTLTGADLQRKKYQSSCLSPISRLTNAIHKRKNNTRFISRIIGRKKEGRMEKKFQCFLQEREEAKKRLNELPSFQNFTPVSTSSASLCV